MTELEKLSVMYWARTAPANSDAEEIAQAYRDGFRKAREMAANYLEPPCSYATLNVPSGEVTWDSEGIKLLQRDIRDLGESEVSA